MASWFKRRRPAAEAPRLKPRRAAAQPERVDLADIAPEPVAFLGQAAYVQLETFESLARVIALVDDLSVKEALGRAAGLALGKHQGLVAELRRHNAEPADAMRSFAPAIDGIRRLSLGRDWREALLGVYVTAGLLDDFFIRVSAGVTGDVGPRVAALLGTDAADDAVVAVLTGEIAAEPQLPSRLALWGRRLVGDTLLVARAALHTSGDRDSDELRFEPVFTEVIAAHTRRMDALGLTA